MKFDKALVAAFLVCALQFSLAEDSSPTGDISAQQADEISRHKAASEQYAAKLRQSEDEITRLRGEMASLRSKESNLIDKSEKLSSQLTDAEKKAEAAGRQAQDAILARQAAEKQLETLRAEEALRTAQLQEKNKELELALQNSKEASQSLQSEAKNARNLIEAKTQLDARVKELSSKIEEAKKSHSSEQRKLEEERNSLKAKLEKERETQKLVIQLRKEKAELQSKVAEAKDSICHKAHEEWIPLAKEALETSLSSVKKLVGDAVGAVDEASKKATESEHAKSLRAAARPHLVNTHATVSRLLRQQLLEKAKSPMPALREVTRNTVKELGVSKQFQDAAVSASDYWLVVFPLVLATIMILIRWLGAGFRHTGLRLQQCLLFLSLSLAFGAWVLDTHLFELLEQSFDAISLTIIHHVVFGGYATAGFMYLAAALFGTGRPLALAQLAAAAWLALAYRTATLVDASPAPGSGFVRDHLLRSLLALLLALLGGSGAPPRKALSKKAAGGAEAPRGPVQGPGRVNPLAAAAATAAVHQQQQPQRGGKPKTKS